MSSGGVISGTLGQSNAGLSAVATVNDVAAASTDIGAATFSTVSQAQMQTLNTLPGGGTSGLNVTQNATAVNFGGENRQNAVTGLGVATISGGVQQMGLPVNVTSLGALGTDSVLQTSNRQAVRLSASVCSNVKPLTIRLAFLFRIHTSFERLISPRSSTGNSSIESIELDWSIFAASPGLRTVFGVEPSSAYHRRSKSHILPRLFPHPRKSMRVLKCRCLAEAKNAICDAFGPQHPLHGVARYPVRVHAIKFDDCRAGQQEG
jgi:hypothetical protein